ncbi:translation initiation factor IF-2 [candidate division WWE3 bacterium CG08_land_8_20_14_0_20_43_13]|uniref:Translation initiation factor IF-2 n=1 Tax=candidate division WWE3 bacterium CG08_land_8_20_14_0_20_43_13 TaxID=1975087 RepID=A0A2H0X7Y5_UNCKA|nr:MAG: translation initiation factor IF-2 [candidate division WWE3 bacterium CG08_land_8_20_14_0_20_43_13]
MSVSSLETTNNGVALLNRPVVVTLLGHVDHGKTTLLDALCGTKITDREVGSMTQQVRAQQLEYKNNRITFVDTPGHAAFSQMRSRGGQLADIVILVVAADDGVMAQTKEALGHARAAGVPIIIAVTKTDLPSSNPAKVYQQLAQENLLAESLGGEVVAVELSAKTTTGLEKLLDMILLVAEVEGLTQDSDQFAKGVVLESWLDSHQGSSVLLIMKSGELSLGDTLYTFNGIGGKVKCLLKPNFGKIDKALPGEAIIVTGLSSQPPVGSVVVGEGGQSYLASLEELISQQKELASLESFSVSKEKGKNLNIVLKADVLGSVEAIKESLLQLSSEECSLEVIFAGTGDVSESDVLLAGSTGSVILGFKVKFPSDIAYSAKVNGVEVRLYELIFDLLDDITGALKGLLTKEQEKIKGRAEVVKLFPLPSGDVVLGCKILGGVISVENKVQVTRQGELIHKSQVSNIKQGAERLHRVSTGAECGLLLKPSYHAKKGDIVDRV